jgi:Transposase DDE domain
MLKPLPDHSNKPEGPEFEELLKDLPPDLLDLAYKCKAFVRARKIKSPAELMRLALSYCGLDQSLREIGASNALRGGQKLSDESVKGRLLACQGWIEALLKELMPPAPKLPEGRRWSVCDGSTVQASGAKRDDYRYHIRIDLVRTTLIEVKVTDYKTGESLAQFSFVEGDVVLTDRGFAYADQIIGAKRRGADVVSRISPHNLPLYNSGGERIDLHEQLRRHPAETIQTIEARIKATEGDEEVKAWVHAYRLDDREAEKAKRRLRKESKKHGREPKAETLFFAGYVLVVTTLAPEVLPAEVVLELYRVRWQVEIAIKRLKSLLDLDALRARRNSPLAKLWLHGKLLYALLIERRARNRVGSLLWTQLDTERRGTWWRVWKLVAAEVKSVVLGHLRNEQWAECLEALAERPRKRKLQKLPAGVVTLLHRTTSFS